jgi:dihydrofolate reductase
MVYWMNVSLDLMIEAEDGERGAGDWLRIDSEVHEAYNALARDLALVVNGRVVYEIMEPFWPAAATDSTIEPWMQEYGRIWTQMPKVLVSNSRTTAKHNTRVVGGADAIGQLAAIRAGTDGAIGVGGATLATALLEHGLLDELLLFAHPTVLGRGRPLFDRVDGEIDCDLREHRVFTNGVAMHRYAILDRSAPSR